MTTPTLYGIANCDTVKKARKWLEANNVEYQFHDFRKDGIDLELVTEWLASVDQDILINRRGTTWRKLPEETRQSLDSTSLPALLVEQPTMIKRPVLQTESDPIQVGFKEDVYKALFD